MSEKDCPNKKVTSYHDNHWTASDHKLDTSRTTYVNVPNKEISKINTHDNKFIHSDENSSSNRVKIITKPISPKVNHQIINLCQSYIESVLFQLDSAPGSSGHIEWNNQKAGRIVNFKYFLDSSMTDNVLVNIDLINTNLGRKSLLNYVAGGNQFIKGTNNSTVLDFKLNQKIESREQVQITYANTSSQDCTIMAICDIKYGEEDF